MTDTTPPPTPVYAEIDGDDLGEAAATFAQAITDISHHEIGDEEWDFHDRADLTGELARFEHRLDQMAEVIKQGRSTVLRVRMIGAVRAIWEHALRREGIPLEADGLSLEDDLYTLVDELARLHTTGIQEQQAHTHHSVLSWGYDLADRAVTTEDEDERERMGDAAERVLAEAITVAWAAVNSWPEPQRFVDSKARSWEREEDGYRWRWGDVPRTRGELEATGARPVGSAPREEVQHVQQTLRALTPGTAEATARAALRRAKEKLSRSYAYSWGGDRRLLAGRPGCWEAEHLDRWADAPESTEGNVDQEIAEQVATTLVGWVIGPQVAYPEDIYTALVQPHGPSSNS